MSTHERSTTRLAATPAPRSSPKSIRRATAAAVVLAAASAIAACGSSGSGTKQATAASGPGGGGKAIFTANGCGGCHTLSKAGAHGQVGPNLDTALRGQSAALVRQSITNPDARITKGFSAGVMPQNFGHSLSPQQLDALVRYLRG